MTDKEMKLDSFKLDVIWQGILFVPWLGGDVIATVDAEDEGIVESQFQCMGIACCLPKQTLQKCQSFLLDEYRNNIYGSIGVFRDGEEVDFHEATPKVSSKEELWSLLSEIRLSFPDDERIDEQHCFEVTAECPWDPEHGLSILFDRNGEPIRVGGQGNHF